MVLCGFKGDKAVLSDPAEELIPCPEELDSLLPAFVFVFGTE